MGGEMITKVEKRPRYEKRGVLYRWQVEVGDQ